MALHMKTVTSPTLTTGAFSIQFGEFAQVTQASLSFDDPATSATAFSAATSISGNTVTVTVSKQDLSSPGAWTAAVTADVASMNFRVIADGQ